MEAILVKLLQKLVSEKFFARVGMLILEALSKYTINTVDDNLCKAVGDALAEPCKID